MKEIFIKTPAKVNLFLEITGRRADGYHDLATLFAKIGIYDDVFAARTGRSGGAEFRLINSSPCELTAGNDNLAVRAALAFKRAFGADEEVFIELEKRIPSGAGLGGGSSDAAAVLLAMAKLFKLEKTARNDVKLRKIAAGLGADVPFFLYKDAFCVGKGIGDRLSPVPAPLPDVFMTLVYPGKPVPTAGVYKRLSLPPKKQVLTKLSALDTLNLILREGLPLEEWGQLLFNRLEEVVLPIHGHVRLLRDELLDLNAGAVLMSGSGSCVFALTKKRAAAANLAQQVAGEGRTVFVTRFVGGHEDAYNRNTHSFNE